MPRSSPHRRGPQPSAAAVSPVRARARPRTRSARSIPVGKDPHLVRAWWEGLTPRPQKDLMRADPVTLAGLTGLPSEVGRWGRQAGTGWDRLDQHAYHSDSWARAEGLQNFSLRHGGREVSRADARPGDVVFYEQVAPGTETAPGETHHAAVVTSVTPDGDIKLTQHTSSFQNVSLDSREHIANRNGGEQRIRIVRPEPDRY